MAPLSLGVVDARWARRDAERGAALNDDAFIDAVLAAPDDDEPRRAYAAHLHARGDPRGEFIDVQLARAKDPNDDALWKREKKILEAHQDAWLAPFGGRIIGVWRRGFPACFVGSGAKFLEARPIIARLPLESLTLVADLKSTVEQVALSPELARFSEIELSAGEPYNKWELGDEAFETFVRSPHLRRIREFVTGWNGLGARGLDALADAPWLPRLTKLIVMKNPLPPDAVARIAPRLSNLRWLDFSSSNAGDEGAKAIANAELSLARVAAALVHAHRSRGRDCDRERSLRRARDARALRQHRRRRGRRRDRIITQSRDAR